MLKLKMATDPTWVKNVVENNIEEILTDHAYCEQKAASSAISIIIQYPEYSELVSKMAEIAREEMMHFGMVHARLTERGFVLGKERKDTYVNQLYGFFKGHKDRRVNLVHKLLFSAMIEARSCERFHVLSKNIADKELAEFYHDLEQSEAEHYRVFISFARQYGESVMDVDKVWNEFLAYEGELIKNYGKKELVHG